MKAADYWLDTPPSVNTKTSREAAETIKPRLYTIRKKVFNHILERKEKGATCEEIERTLHLRHQTVSPAVRGLELLGAVFRAGDTRKNDSGRQAMIYRSYKHKRL